jgi:hypothetical protein
MLMRLSDVLDGNVESTQENGGALSDSAIPCSSMIHADKVTAWQLHRSVRPLDLGRARGESLRASSEVVRLE